jgi:hypothetical protein
VEKRRKGGLGEGSLFLHISFRSGCEVRGRGVKSQPLSPGEIGCDRDGHTTDTHLKVRKNQTH